MKISFFTIIHNEEKLLDRCLDSIKDIADEIILIHDGPCTDNSIKIAEKYNCKIYISEKNLGIGEKHYLKALSMCVNDWVFKIDADEYLHTEDKDKILSLTNSNDYSGYYFIWPLSWDGNSYRGGYSLTKLCLFKKSEIGYISIFHLPIILKGKGKEVDIVLEHKPLKFMGSKEFKDKLLKWARLQAEDMTKNLRNFETYNLDHKELDKELKKLELKKMVYKFPILTFFLSFIVSILNTSFKRSIIHQVYVDYLLSIYSYNVAKFYNEIKKNIKI